MSKIIIYQGKDNNIKIDVKFDDETIWLSQTQIEALFNKGKSTITEHILNVFKEGELDEKLVCRNYRHTTQHGAIPDKTQGKEVKTLNSVEKAYLETLKQIEQQVRKNKEK